MIELPDPGATSISAAPPDTPRSADTPMQLNVLCLFPENDDVQDLMAGLVLASMSGLKKPKHICALVTCTMLRAKQAFFLYSHLEGEARSEIKYRSSTNKIHTDRIISALRELYGSAESYVALQEAFFFSEATRGRNIVRVLPRLDEPPGES